MKTSATLSRTAFVTDRRQEFFTKAELRLQLGYDEPQWPLVIAKESLDNALDAAESTAVSPEIAVTLEADSLTIEDNGPGLTNEIIQKSLDYSTRISDKRNYVAPTRGQLGVALKALWATPYVATGKTSVIEIEACGLRHRVAVDVDRIAQEPRIEHSQEKTRSVKKGTSVMVHWNGIASLLVGGQDAEFYRSTVADSLPELVRDFAAINPHASFTVTAGGKKYAFKAPEPAWRKWRANDPTSAHWYSEEDMRALIAAYVGAAKRGGKPMMTIRDFVAKFDKLSGTQVRARVLQEAGLDPGASLSDLVTGGDLDMVRVARLLAAMRHNSKPAKPQRLGVIGREHLRRALVAYGADPEGVEYARHASFNDHGLPFVAEFAFAVRREHERRKLIFGLNNSPTFRVPSAHLSALMSSRYVYPDEPVVLLVHQCSPKFSFVSRGKGSVA